MQKNVQEKKGKEKYTEKCAANKYRKMYKEIY